MEEMHLKEKKRTRRASLNLHEKAFNALEEMVTDLRNDPAFDGISVSMTSLMDSLILRAYEKHRRVPLKPKDL